MRRVGGPLGLLGRIFAILLLTVVIEFGASIFLYERAGNFSVREDDARRLAEHLVIARKLLAEQPIAARGRFARELTTDRYDVSWSMTLPPAPPIAPMLDATRRQILAWEPQLASSAIRLRLDLPTGGSAISGELRLPEGDWMLFRSHETDYPWEIALSRVAMALVPAIALLILSGLLIRRTLMPLRTLARATERVGLSGNVMIAEDGSLEVRQLIQSFNAMQHRIHALIEDRTHALAAVGHDLRTPLARVQLRAEGIDDPALRTAIARDVGEMEAMLGSLLAFLGGEDDPEAAVATDVAVMAATIVDDVSDHGGVARYAGPDHAEIRLRPTGFKRALANVVENALHYGGEATVTLIVEDRAVTIHVDDAGPGIAADRMEDVLRPFTRLDSARARNTNGLGLGLAIVAGAVAREQGELRLSNRSEGGLRVTIIIPRSH